MAELVCMPQNYICVLRKITIEWAQEFVVKMGVNALFYKNKTEYLDPLLSALKEGTFLSTDLVNIAIRSAFWYAPSYQDNRSFLAKRFFDHPAVSAVYYSEALHCSYKLSTKELFYWLLTRADHQDLEVVKGDVHFSAQEPEFQQAVDKALRKVDPDPRDSITLRRIETTEALKDILPKDLVNVIGEYVELHDDDPDMRFGLIHQKSKALLRETLAEHVPQDVIAIIDDY